MACTCAAELTAISDEFVASNMFWQDFRMEIGQGLASYASAIENCCLGQIAQQNSDITYTYDVFVPDGMGGGSLQPATKTTPIAGQGFAAACANSQAYEAAQTGWQEKYQAWLNLQTEWQNNQQALSILSTIANLIQLCTALECRNDMYKLAKGKIKTVIGICDASAAKVSSGGSALMAYCDKAALYPGTGANAYTPTNTQTAIATYAGWQTTLFNLWNNDGAGGGLAYMDIQADHIDNMATHLAQLCTNARDISNNLTTMMQYLDDSWNTAAGDWASYETCLHDGPAGVMGAVSLADQLCASATFVKNCQDSMKECGDMLAKCFATDDGTGGLFITAIKPMLGTLITNMTEMNGAIAELEDLADDAKTCLETMKLNYTQVIDPVESTGGAVEQILANADCLFGDSGQWKGTTFFKDCIGMLQDCAEDKKDIFDRYLGTLTANGSSGEYCLGRVIIDQACGLVKNLDDAVQFMGQHKEDCIDIFESTYQVKEEALSLALLNAACDVANCFMALKTYLETHSDDMDACYEDFYQDGEKAWAVTMLDEANQLAATHFETFTFLCDCADAAKACWTDDYAPKEKLLTQAIMQEGCDLAPCVSDAHDWLCDCADYLKDRYKNFWEGKEDDYVCAMMDKSIELACESYDCIADWCDLLDEQYLDWWKCYEDQEKIAGPKIIGAGDEACEKNIQMYLDTCDRSEHLWDKFDDEWCPCDINDLQKHCDIWNKTNFLEEICENNECIQGLGETLKNCYEDLVLPCEKEYIEEICNLMKYEPKYCEMEDRAVLHVRKRFDLEADELERCITPYCRGAFVDRVSDLRDQQIKAEQLSIQLADRWEWLRETQECDRRHRYRLEIFELGERYATNSAAFYQQSTLGNDLILQRIHERISRGYQYMNGAFNQSQQTLTAVAQAVESSLRGIDIGHFWPQWWNDGRDRYLNQSNNRFARSHEILQIGQRHLENSFNNKQAAAQIAQNAIDDGLQTVDRGHNLLNTAINSKVQANNVAAQAADDALQAIDRGHYFIDASHRDRQLYERTAVDASQLGQRAIDHGHNHKKMALDAAMGEWQGAHAGVQDGLASIDRGHWWLENMREDKRLAMQGYQDVWQQFQGQLQTAYRQMELALAWDRSATDKFQAEKDCGFQGMDYLLNTFNAANRKQETALNAGLGQMQGAVQFLAQGYDRLQMQLGNMNSMQSQIRQSTDGLVNMAHEGNQTFLLGAQNTALNEARIKKDCERFACDVIRGTFNDLARVANNAGCCVLGPILGSAANLDNEVANYGAGVFSGLTGAIGPPPQPNFGSFINAQPPTVTTVTGSASGGSGGSDPGSWYGPNG